MVTRSDIVGIVDRQPTSSYLIFVIGLLVALQIVDGVDLVAMSYAAPEIIREFAIERSAMGSVFGIGFAGMAGGALLFGPLADRVGRKPIILMVVSGFGICSLATSVATSLGEIFWLRLASGLLLGGLYPPVMTLALEIAPAKWRAAVGTIVSMGSMLGGAACGLIAAAVVPEYGWRSLFQIGGALPLLLALIAAVLLPESPRYLLAHDPDGNRLRRVFEGLSGRIRIAPGTPFRREAALARVPGTTGGVFGTFSPRPLFFSGSAGATMLLWAGITLAASSVFALTSWLPALTEAAGASAADAALAGASYSAFGVVGGLAATRFVDRLGIRAIIALPLVGGCAIALLGLYGYRPGYLALAALAGLVASSINLLAAVAGLFYPDAIRARAIGWLMTVMRIGAGLGPWAVGYLFAAKIGLPTVFIAIAAPALLSTLALVALLGMDRNRLHATAAHRVRIDGSDDMSASS